MLLGVILAFAFFHHIQVQARDLLLPGVAVAAVAFILLGINTQSFFIDDSKTALQSAAVASYAGVVLTPQAAAIER
jgi:hypothetical protein